MKLIAQADVVLALGTRLGPFGTLPQYELDYWPQHAKIIQVDEIPRTISGKIVELAVRDVIHGRVVRNKDALANPEALRLYENLEELKG